MNKVCVIVPIYNAEKTLENCLNSIINQTVQADEILLIDDCSTDNSRFICEEFQSKYNNIQVINNTVNKGVSYSRNIGTEKSKCDCLLFIDSDDYIGDDYIETLLSYSDADFVTCGYHFQNIQGAWEEKLFCEEFVSTDIIKKMPSKYLGKYYFGAPWGKLYKKRIIEEYQVKFDINMKNGEDILFTFDYLQHTKSVRIISLASYYYTYQESSLSHKRYPDFWKWRIIQEKRINHFFCPVSNEEKNYLLTRQFDLLQSTIAYYDGLWNNRDIALFIRNDLFIKPIGFKKKHGDKNEKKYLWLLETHHYIEYKKIKTFIYNIKQHFSTL